MKLYSRHEPVGFTYHADCYCSKCGENLPDIDPEGNDKHPIFSWETSEFCYPDEFDGMPVFYSCGECGEPANEW